MAKSGMRLDTAKLQVNLDKLDRNVELGIAAAVDLQATRTEFFMKTNARWTDQTGYARGGLFTATKKTGKSFFMLLSHTASYGIWLEVRFSGRYEIIGPALLYTAGALPAVLKKLVMARS